jgi:hypothetical protein
VLILDKSTIEKVFSNYYVIDPPKNVIILDRPAVSVDFDRQTMIFFKGLQPKWRDDVIILTPQGDDETLVHEALHAQYRVGEPGANFFGKLLVKKYRLTERLPSFRRMREVKYRECNDCELCINLQELLLTTPPNSDAKHYVLVS